MVAVLNLESTRAGRVSRPAPAARDRRGPDRGRDRQRAAVRGAEAARAADGDDERGLAHRARSDRPRRSCSSASSRYIHERFPLELVSIVMYDAERDEFVNMIASAGDAFVAPAQRWPIDLTASSAAASARARRSSSPTSPPIPNT